MPFLLPFLAFSPGGKSQFSPLTHSSSWPPPSPPPPHPWILGDFSFWSSYWHHRIPGPGPTESLLTYHLVNWTRGRGLSGEAGPICFSLKLLRGKHMLCSVLCRDGRWCLLGTGCSFGKVQWRAALRWPVWLDCVMASSPCCQTGSLTREEARSKCRTGYIFINFFLTYIHSEFCTSGIWLVPRIQRIAWYPLCHASRAFSSREFVPDNLVLQRGLKKNKTKQWNPFDNGSN